MHLISFSILLLQVTAYALPAASLSISTRGDAPEKIVLDGKPYTATPLPDGYQGFDQAFKLEGGFPVGGKLVPAILNRVFEKEGSDNPNSRTLHNIEFLKKPSVDLHLFSTWSKTKMRNLPYQVDIIVKDLRESDPPLRPFNEWYQEDKRINGIVGLYILCENVKSRLVWYAKHENLLYHGFGMGNIFVQKKAITDDIMADQYEGNSLLPVNAPIMPIDWELPQGQVYGVVDITDKNNKEELIEKYEVLLNQELEASFGVDVLEEMLQPEGELRSNDIRQIPFRGKTYNLLQLRHVDSFTILYVVVGGFEKEETGEAVPAVMTVFERKRGGIRGDDELHEGGDVIAQTGENEKGKYFITVYTRPGY